MPNPTSDRLRPEGRRPWCLRRHPEGDEALRVGLTLIDLLFGLVLAQEFAITANGYRKISGAGWTHLIVAVMAIILSWVGYHNLRRKGPLWALQFFNRPLLQYFVDFLIVATYWGLIITAEGVPPGPDKPTHQSLYVRSARPECLLICFAFLLYLSWDLLEVSIRENEAYVRQMVLSSSEPTPCRSDVRLRLPFLGEWQPHGRRKYFADTYRIGALVTGFFLIVNLILLVVIWGRTQTNHLVWGTDTLLVFGLVLYRYAQAVIPLALLQKQGPR